HVADQPHPVADDDGGAAQFLGPHRHHSPLGVVAQRARPAAAVDRDHHRFDRVLVLGAAFAARSAAPASWTYSHIRFVKVVPATPGHQRTSASMPFHIAGKSGSVFDVVAMSSTCTPGTRRPRIAPAVAIRWSA